MFPQNGTLDNLKTADYYQNQDFFEPLFYRSDNIRSFFIATAMLFIPLNLILCYSIIWCLQKS